MVKRRRLSETALLQKMRVSFIGGGNMANAIIGGLKAAGVSTDEIVSN